MQEESILKIEHLKTVFDTSKGVSLAVNDVSIDVPKGKIIGIVGESGCGKSVTAKSIMGLLKYPGRIESGSISFDGKDLTKLSDNELRDISGNDISMIFQEPMTSLNPVVKVGKQVREALMAHDISMNKSEAKIKVLDMFEKVGISDPAARYENYPFELSGGIRQRIMIAMAMICNPKLLIADEPTTALDVTIEAQILRLMKFLSTTYGMSIILITHSLGVVAQICDYVYVMYAGRIMEQSETSLRHLSFLITTRSPTQKDLCHQFQESVRMKRGFPLFQGLFQMSLDFVRTAAFLQTDAVMYAMNATRDVRHLLKFQIITL